MVVTPPQIIRFNDRVQQRHAAVEVNAREETVWTSHNGFGGVKGLRIHVRMFFSSGCTDIPHNKAWELKC